jgi:hypothetical protein
MPSCQGAMGARRGPAQPGAPPATRRAGARQAQAAPASTINTQLSRIPTYERFSLQGSIGMLHAQDKKFSLVPHLGHRLCNANHLRFRRYPKVRLLDGARSQSLGVPTGLSGAAWEESSNTQLPTHPRRYWLKPTSSQPPDLNGDEYRGEQIVE